MKQNEITLGRFLRIVVVLAVVVISYFVLDSLSGVLLPFAVAWLLAYLLHPLVNFIQYRMRFRYRALSIFSSFLFVALFLYGIVVAVVPSMHDEVLAMRNITVEFLSKNIRNSTIPEPIMEFFKEMSDKEGITAFLQGAGDGDLFTLCVDRAKAFLLGTLNVVSQLFNLFIILLYLFFILLDFDRMTKGWKPYVPKKWRGVVSKLWNDLVIGMNQYFRGQALVALCVGVLFATGFLIIGFPMAIVFGLFIGLLNLVPYLQLISLVPMVLLSMLKAENTGGDFWLILLSAFAVLAVVQLIQDLVLVPRIMGKRMNLHPAVILLSLSVWGHLLGVLGMIVALPLTTLFLAYLRRYHEIAENEGYSDGRAFKEAIDSANVGSKSASRDNGKLGSD